jgi:adenine-specific DNA methylase
MTKRLIEEWLPIAELGIESVREPTPMTPFPAPNRLHVWWARRPLVASRAAVLGSLLPADADRGTFMHMLGIHGDPVAAKKAMDKARRTRIRIDNPYGFDRAFQYSPSEKEEFWLLEETQKLGIDQPTVLDPTAGGGAIPFEALRLGCHTLANDINPVAELVQKATYEWPSTFGRAVVEEYERIAAVFRHRLEERLSVHFPQHQAPDQLDCTYLWARTIHSP